MTGPNEQLRLTTPGGTSRPGLRHFRRLAVAVGLLLAAFGCKSKDGGGGGGSGLMSKGHDPLVMGPGRIPKQNIPIPERGSAGKDRDPLLGSPAGRAADTKSGASYSTDPNRWKGGPYIPDMGGTPAALAGRPKDDDGLKIDSADGGVRPVGGTVPAGTPRDTDGLLTELQKYGVKRNDYKFDREGGSAIFRARVPIGDDRVREYTGQGATPADAVRQVLEQVKSDRR